MTTGTTPKPRTAKDDVFRWRFDCLRRTGYSHYDARVLARAEVDLHLACELLLRGCPAALALRILL